MFIYALYISLSVISLLDQQPIKSNGMDRH